MVGVVSGWLLERRSAGCCSIAGLGGKRVAGGEWSGVILELSS